MADDGYLIGYEDSNNNFVEVGRFNNTAEDVTQPIIIQHSDSGQQMELGPNGFSTESVSTEKIGSERLYAGSYPGTDADARLTNAIADASDGDLIALENAFYEADRTISKRLAIIGTFAGFGEGSVLIDVTWTLDSRCRLVGIGGGGPNDSTIVVNDSRTGIFQVGGSTLNIDFASGTGDGIVDGVTGNVNVTDPDGNNTLGSGV